MTLERAVEDGKQKKFISVDDARSLPGLRPGAWQGPTGSLVEFLARTATWASTPPTPPAKTLEEPLRYGVLLLVAHAPGRLVATIRSRCRRLAFAPWPVDAVADFLRRRAGTEEDEALAIAEMAKGAPGHALRLAESQALELDAVARALAYGASPPATELLALADSFRGQPGQARFELFFERLAEAVRAAATEAGADPSLAARWADLWDKFANAPGEAEAIDRPSTSLPVDGPSSAGR